MDNRIRQNGEARLDEVSAIHNQMMARGLMFKVMVARGLVKDIKEFDIKYWPVIEMVLEGALQTSDKHIDDLTHEARDKIAKIREVGKRE